MTILQNRIFRGNQCKPKEADIYCLDMVHIKYFDNYKHRGFKHECPDGSRQ